MPQTRFWSLKTWKVHAHIRFKFPCTCDEKTRLRDWAFTFLIGYVLLATGFFTALLISAVAR